MAGDSSRAGSLSQALSKQWPLDTQMQSLWLPTIEAQLALDRKNAMAAVDHLNIPKLLEPAMIPFLTNISCLHSVYVRAEANLAAGRGHAAAEEFQRILDHTGVVWNCSTGPMARLGLARAYALQAGPPSDSANPNKQKAVAAYRDVLDRWKDADPNIPIRKEAEAEFAKLQ